MKKLINGVKYKEILSNGCLGCHFKESDRNCIHHNNDRVDYDIKSVIYKESKPSKKELQSRIDNLLIDIEAYEKTVESYLQLNHELINQVELKNIGLETLMTNRKRIIDEKNNLIAKNKKHEVTINRIRSDHIKFAGSANERIAELEKKDEENIKIFHSFKEVNSTLHLRLLRSNSENRSLKVSIASCESALKWREKREDKIKDVIDGSE